MNARLIAGTLLGALLLTVGCATVPRRADTSPSDTPAAAASAPDEFAPVSDNHPLASIWNDPAFTRRLLESYAPEPNVEPQVSPEEGFPFREEIVPLLRDDREKAIKQLKGLIKTDSTALFEFTIGNVYFQDGDLTNAVRYFEQAVAKFPDFQRAWQNLGFAHARNGHYGKAIEPLAHSLSLGATDSKAFGLLGFCYMNDQQWISAESAYRQAMLMEPDNADYKLGIVKCQVAQENYTPALAMLDELLMQYPEREQIWNIQANVYLQTGHPVKAAVNLEVLRRMGKATPKNLTLLGDTYMVQEATGLALAAYLEAIKVQGRDDLSSALRAAEIMVGRGAWEESEKLFSTIRAVAGDSLTGEDELRLLKLESKVAMATGSGEEAIQVLEQIAAKNPMDGEALLLAGDYYARTGDKERAQLRYDLASKIDGFEADALVKQAQLLARASKYVDAVELLRRAQKIRPRDNVQRYLEAIQRVARTSSS